MIQVETLPIPRFIITVIVRYLIRRRLANELAHQSAPDAKEEFIKALDAAPIAVKTEAANSQHYEVPSAFYQLVLGPHLKYSSCLFRNAEDSLGAAEAAMLDLYIERAELKPGQRLLELGCGWGSLCLHVARRFPESKITAVSNSTGQKAYIDSVIAEEKLNNLEIITADINKFEFSEKADRIVSIEMFEHLRNYKSLFGKLSSWLKDDGKLFVHIFCHKELIYFFEEEGVSNWMGRHFFSGGIMPSFDLFTHYPESLRMLNSWKVNGNNYYLTALAWEKNLLANRLEVLKIFAATYGKSQAYLYFKRWQFFFIACQELFRFEAGEQWYVGHYLMERSKNV
jgi:cyclopropane-fatty-acyl-phospholipid synthase